MKSYSQNTIIALCQFLLGDEDAGEWLAKHDCKELTWLAGFIINRRNGYDSLVQHGHYQLVAFCDALLGDSDAFKYLLNSDHKVWAATVNAANGDDDAIAWLERNGYAHYVHLASVIIRKWREYDSTD